MKYNDSCSTLVLRLSLINGVGERLIGHITNDYTRTLEALHYVMQISCADELCRLYGLSQTQSLLVFNGLRDNSKFEEELRLLKIHNAYYVTPYDKTYPDILRHLDSKPAVLYFQGDNLFNKIPYKYVAAIGSRAISDYGVRAMRFFLKEFEHSNVVIVSGGAIGGDSIAHNCSLELNLKTIVVLGSGLAHWYPASNNQLFKKIIAQGGMIISPFSMDQEPHKGTFPARNAIIAGLSDLIFIAQAGKKSGTLITARLGIDMGKEVAVVPGRFDDELSQGCHELLSQGAHIISQSGQLKELITLSYSYHDHNASVHNTHTNDNTMINEKKPAIELSIISFCKKPRYNYEVYQTFPNIDHKTLDSLLYKLIIEKNLFNDILGRYYA